MSSRDWTFRIRDILASIQKIEVYLSDLTMESIAKIRWNLIFQDFQKSACLEMRPNPLWVSQIENKMIFWKDEKADQRILAIGSIDQFKQNNLVIDAVVRNFEIIGEASKSVPQAIRKSHPNIPWEQMSGMRNILIHEYFGIDIDTIWHTAKLHLPSLKKQLELVLS